MARKIDSTASTAERSWPVKPRMDAPRGSRRCSLNSRRTGRGITCNGACFEAPPACAGGAPQHDDSERGVQATRPPQTRHAEVPARSAGLEARFCHVATTVYIADLAEFTQSSFIWPNMRSD